MRNIRNIVSNDQKIGWALIGASTMAREVVNPIIKNLSDSYVAGVYSSSFKRGKDFADANKIAKAYETLNDVITDDSVHVVYISTTNDLHKEQVIAAAKAGKHILCEKPLTISIADAEEMVRIAENEGVVFGVFHHQPALPQYMLVKKLVEEGAIGIPLALRICHTIHLPKDQLGSWRTNNPEKGAGVIFDLTAHDIDTSRFILDDDIDEIYATGEARGVVEGKGDVFDNVMGIMKTKKGVMVSFHDSYMINNASGCEVMGTKGSIAAKEYGPYARIPAKEITLMHDRIKDDIQYIKVEDQTDPLVGSIIHFNEAVRGKGKVVRTGMDGAKETAAIMTAIQSCKSGRLEKVPEIKV